jgi:uncharacterized protein (TIGR02271 family)
MINTTTQQWHIPAGTEVRSADDAKLGKVIATQPDYLVVEKGFFFPTDYYVPSSAISTYDGDRVYLSVTKDAALATDWDRQPADWGAATSGGDFETAAGATGTHETTTERIAGDTLRVPVHEEELVATKRPVERGDVEITKDVVEEERVMDVPVTEERVRVTRRTVDRDAETGELAFEEGMVEVPVRGEAVDVETRTRVAEEVEIAKEQVQRTERVGGTVRKERVRVEDHSDADVIGEPGGVAATWDEADASR